MKPASVIQYGRNAPYCRMSIEVLLGKIAIGCPENGCVNSDRVSALILLLSFWMAELPGTDSTTAAGSQSIGEHTRMLFIVEIRGLLCRKSNKSRAQTDL